MSRAALWWQGLTARERVLVAVAGGLLALVFVWLAVLRPLDRAVDDARRRHARGVVALAEARAQADEVRRLAAALPAAQGAPADIAAAAAQAAGLPLSRAEPVAPDGVALAIDAARPAALWPWIGTLERAGLTISELSVRANPDRTVAVRLVATARRG